MDWYIIVHSVTFLLFAVAKKKLIRNDGAYATSVPTHYFYFHTFNTGNTAMGLGHWQWVRLENDYTYAKKSIIDAWVKLGRDSGMDNKILDS